MEIFEAGTGHGSLTLHLSRAIHGADTPDPRIPPSSPAASEDEREDVYKTWRENRQAVIHSLDRSSAHSAHAQNVVKSFRRGMYFPHIDFHVGEIGDYLSSRLASTNQEPFLSHAILDLPDPSLYLEILGQALNPFGKLVTFSPSITQTVHCLETVEEQGLPFMLERVLEVGAGFGSGGREWDVRSVLPRSIQRNMKAAEETSEASEESNDNESEGLTQTSGESDVKSFQDKRKEGWEIACRPKVGLSIEGGGFIGLWRRKHFKGQDEPHARYM